MRYGTIAALVMLPAVLSQTPATALPCLVRGVFWQSWGCLQLRLLHH